MVEEDDRVGSTLFLVRSGRFLFGERRPMSSPYAWCAGSHANRGVVTPVSFVVGSRRNCSANGDVYACAVGQEKVFVLRPCRLDSRGGDNYVPQEGKVGDYSIQALFVCHPLRHVSRGPRDYVEDNDGRCAVRVAVLDLYSRRAWSRIYGGKCVLCVVVNVGVTSVTPSNGVVARFPVRESRPKVNRPGYSCDSR